jgi:hypothetical protein
VDRERIETFLRRYWRAALVAAASLAVGVLLLLEGPPRESSVARSEADLVRACGYGVTVRDPSISRDIARGMRKDCGIYGPQGTSGD